ncbi:progestin and adipoQ receptor family member 4-like [Sycon ciliatum]|uniref:progestin and adipoQ receptor family member 4-like n=1 Tax=Sycon ciliatum TaxID=27933 RepID=UPI0031F5F260
MLLCSSCCEPLEKVESHRAFNRHILAGYRPATGVLGCLKSLLYFHNETINVYTHGLYMLFLLVALPHIITWPSDPSLWWLVFLSLAGHVSCMFGSVVYHLFNSLLQSASDYWTLLQFDVAGIWLANSMNTCIYVYLSFYCDDTLRRVGSSLLLFISLITFLPTMRARTPAKRAVVFALFLLVRIFTTTSRQLFSTAIGSTNNAWFHYTMTDVFLFIGAVINAARYPEKKWPGCFDLVCSSHQLFHVIVIIALIHNMTATSLDVRSASEAVCLVQM